MKFISNLFPEDSIDNQFSAMVRVMQRRFLADWTPDRWRDALVAWGDGLLAPATLHVDGDLTSYPCAYIEAIPGEGPRGVIATPAGLYQDRQRTYVIHVENTWDVSEQAKIDAEQIGTHFQKYHVNIHRVREGLGIEVATPTVVKDGDAYQRFPFQGWTRMVSNSRNHNLPDFPDKDTFLNWVIAAACMEHQVKAQDLFDVLGGEHAAQMRFSGDADWLNVKDKLSVGRIAGLDHIDTLPCTQPAFIDWLSRMAYAADNNVRGLARLAIQGHQINGPLGETITKGFEAWTSSNPAKIESWYKNADTPWDLIRTFHEVAAPCAEVQHFMWTHISRTLRGNVSYELMAELAGAISKHNATIYPNEDWFHTMEAHLLQSDKPLERLPATLVKQFLDFEMTSAKYPRPDLLLRASQAYFKQLPIEAGQALLARFCTSVALQSNRHSNTAPELHQFCCTLWPQQQDQWNAMLALGCDASAWGASMSAATVDAGRDTDLPALDLF